VVVCVCVVLCNVDVEVFIGVLVDSMVVVKVVGVDSEPKKRTSTKVKLEGAQRVHISAKYTIMYTSTRLHKHLPMYLHSRHLPMIMTSSIMPAVA